MNFTLYVFFTYYIQSFQSSINDQQFKHFRVLLLGSGQVGKSSLCAQFMSSDHVNTYLRVGKISLRQYNFHVHVQMCIQFYDQSFICRG